MRAEEPGNEQNQQPQEDSDSIRSIPLTKHPREHPQLKASDWPLWTYRSCAMKYLSSGT